MSAEDIIEQLKSISVRVENALGHWEKLKDFEFNLCSPAIYMDREGQYATLYIFGIERYNSGGLHEAREACRIVFPDWSDSITEMSGQGNEVSVTWSCAKHPEFHIYFSCSFPNFPKELMKKGCEWVKGDPIVTERFALSCQASK